MPVVTAADPLWDVDLFEPVRIQEVVRQLLVLGSDDDERSPPSPSVHAAASAAVEYLVDYDQWW
jgi:hypothetical protein